MRIHATLPHPHGLHRGNSVTVRALARSQTFRDKLYVAGVMTLVLATVALVIGYGIHEWPRWKEQSIGGFDATVLPLPTEVTPEEAAAINGEAPLDGGLNRTTLIIISMLVDTAIFVGLGLFLRHEMHRKP